MRTIEELQQRLEEVRREWDEWIAEESPSPLSIGHAPFRDEVAYLEDEIARLSSDTE